MLKAQQHWLRRSFCPQWVNSTHLNSWTILLILTNMMICLARKARLRLLVNASTIWSVLSWEDDSWMMKASLMWGMSLARYMFWLPSTAPQSKAFKPKWWVFTQQTTRTTWQSGNKAMLCPQLRTLISRSGKPNSVQKLYHMACKHTQSINTADLQTTSWVCLTTTAFNMPISGTPKWLQSTKLGLATLILMAHLLFRRSLVEAPFNRFVNSLTGLGLLTLILTTALISIGLDKMCALASTKIWMLLKLKLM